MSIPAMPSPPPQGDYRDSHGYQAAPRKQNIACDACRTRKVKCVHPRGALKCNHCLQKKIQCTHVVQRQTSDRKKAKAAGSKSRAQATSVPPLPRSPQHQPNHRASSNSSTERSSSSPSRSASTDSGFSTPTSHLVTWLLAPDDDTSPMPDVANSWRFHQSRSLDYDAVSFESLSEADQSLANEHARNEFALDLTETFFQIVHIRLPLLNPDLFRARLRDDISTSMEVPIQYQGQELSPLPPAMLAAVMASGAKFSDHHIIQMDRQNNHGRSRIAQRLVRRAREVAEAEHVYKKASFDNVIVSILLDGLETLAMNDPDVTNDARCFWAKVSVNHIFTLGYNKEHVVAAVDDPEVRGSTLFAWWITCLSDSYSAAFFRRKPLIGEVDYTHAAPAPNPHGFGQQADFAMWLHAAHDLAVACRKISRSLFSPQPERDGIALYNLRELVTALSAWRDDHLAKVGVPQQQSIDWDFIKAITACTSDAHYHVLWIVVWRAVKDFGIMESNRLDGDTVVSPIDANTHQIAEKLKKEVRFEALHAAQRIAGLANVLTDNGYLRLDPNILHFGIYAAGLLLAEEALPDALQCIKGLRQYGSAYEDAYQEADQLSKLFTDASVEKQRRQASQRQAELARANQQYLHPPVSPTTSISPVLTTEVPSVSLQGSIMDYSPHEMQSQDDTPYMTYISNEPNVPVMATHALLGFTLPHSDFSQMMFN